MRPIPASRLGDAHGLFRAIEQRGRLRTDEFVTEFSLDELFPPGLENALGRLRHFISFGRAAGLVKEDRGVVELTDIGQRYMRVADADNLFEVTPQQAEWLRRQLRELHMTDSIYHGLAIGLSLLASCPPGQRVSTMDFGRSLAYLGRAGWDNENTLEIQGERYLRLLRDMEIIDEQHRVTETGEQVRGELTLPVHMSLIDIAAQQNPGGLEAVREAAEREWGQPAAEPESIAQAAAAPAEAAPAPVEEDDNGYHDVGPGAWAPAPEQPAAPESVPPPAAQQPASQAPPSAGAAPAGAAAGPAPDDGAAGAAPGAPSVAEAAAGEGAAGGVQGAAGVSAGAGVAPGDGTAGAAPGAAGVPGVGEPAPGAGSGAAGAAGVPGTVAGAGGATSAAAGGVPGGEAAAGAAGGVPGAAAAGGVPGVGEAAAGVGGVPGGAGVVSDASGVAPDAAGAALGAAAQTPGAGGVAPGAGRADAAAPGAAGAAGAAALAPDAGAMPGAAGVAPGGGAVPGAAGAGAMAGAAGVAPPGAASVAPPVAGAPEAVELDPTVVSPSARSAVAAARVAPPAFVEAGAIKSAAEAVGLRLPDGVYANVAAALASGKHLLLTGAPGSGKTTLAMAVAKAATHAGKAHGATVTTGAPPQGLILEAAARGRWLIADELDQSDPDEALGALSTFLAGVPVAIEGGEEAQPAEGWRIVATWGAHPPRGATLRRFAIVEVAAPPAEQLRAAINEAAGGDPHAVHAAERLLALADLAPIGAGVFLAAARHAAARQAVAPADGATLAREAYTAYVAPLLSDLDADGERRVRDLLG